MKFFLSALFVGIEKKFIQQSVPGRCPLRTRATFVKLGVPYRDQTTELLNTRIVHGNVEYLVCIIFRITLVKGRCQSVLRVHVRVVLISALFLHTCWVRGHELTVEFHYLLFVG